MKKSAIIVGATGLTGGILLNKLLADDRYDTIKVFGRSSVGMKHPKLEEHLVDLFELEQHADQFTADEVYCCIGTTKKKTPDEQQYRKIDFGIPTTAANLCKANDISTFLVMSSMGANPDSSIFYSRTKGEMEVEVLAQNIEHTFILRPSLITGNRSEKRSLEKFMVGLMSVVNVLLIRALKKYRSIKASDIAQAMIHLANEKPDQSVFDSAEIQILARRENKTN